MNLQALINNTANDKGISLSTEETKVQRNKGTRKHSKLLELDEEQRARIGTVVEKKSEVLQKNEIAGGRAKSCFHSVSERKKGKVISSSWSVYTHSDGSIFKANSRVREYENMKGEVCRVNDQTLLITAVGPEIEKVRRSHKLIETALGKICLLCLTSDYIADVRKKGSRDEVLYSHCTRCDASSKGF